MTSDEFEEIHEAWAEIKICFDEIDAWNLTGSGAYPVPVASAQ